MRKVCSKCLTEKPLEGFPKHPQCLDGHKGVCKQCTYAQQKIRGKLNGNKDTVRYRKTPKGYLMTTYTNMTGRVKGNVKPHLYKGLDILPREDFYAWALKDSTFTDMLTVYAATGYDQRFAPSIDRIDTKEGYVIGNIRWLTHSENSSLGGQNK